MASLQTGQRDRSLSANVIMAWSTFLKHAGCSVTLWPLLLGILLQPVLVSGQNTTDTNTSSTTATAMPMTTATNMITNSTATNLTTAEATMMLTEGTTSVTSWANTTSATQTSTSGTNSGSTAPISGTPVTGAAINSTAASTAMAMSSNMSTSGNMNSSSSANMMQFYCPSFTCNYSDCYTMYNTQNASWCPADCYCQLMRQMDQCYTVNCSMSCAVSCNDSTQINCSVDCCNSTGCLNSSFADMMMTTSTVTALTPLTTTMTTTPVATMASTSPPTTANKGNKCQKGVCTGATCYKDFTDMQTCSASQPHCQLKKEMVDSNMQWTAGCTTNCSSQTPCKDTAKPPCHLECCNSTMTPCLWLNGTLNVPSSATRGLHLSTELLASLLCLLSIAMLL